MDLRKADAKANSATLPRADRLVTWGAGAALAVFYFALRTQNHSFDSVTYALGADVKDATAFFHQNHLFFTPLTWLLMSALKALGYKGLAFGPLAALSALLTGGAAAFFYLALRRLAAPRAAALIALGAAAFSAAWWSCAAETEILALVSFFVLSAVWFLAVPRVGWGRLAAVAAWLGAGTLIHQTLVLFVPVAAVLVGWPRGGRAARVAAFLAVYAAVVVPAYIIIPAWYYGVRSPSAWFGWMYYYGRVGCGISSWARLGRGLVTLLRSVVATGPNPFLPVEQGPPWKLGTLYGPAVVVLGGAAAAVAAAARRLWRERRPWLVACAGWFLFYHLFYSWWQPENAEWWIATTIPVWLLAGLSMPRGRWLKVAAVAAVCGAAALNYERAIKPAAKPGVNEAEAAARGLLAVTAPGDVVLISDEGVWLWTDTLGRHTRLLQRYAFPPPTDPTGPVVPPQINMQKLAAAGWPVYFTDYEWDNAGLAGRTDAASFRERIFRMIRGSEPAAAVPFPGYPAVVYRFRRVAWDISDVAVYEPPNGGPALLGMQEDRVTFDVDVAAPGRYRLCLVARGRPAEGIWPVMAVAVDGVTRGSVAVTSACWCFYEMGVNLDAGRHAVTATFKNDYWNAVTDANRDLLVNRLVLYRRPASGGAAPGGDRP